MPLSVPALIAEKLKTKNSRCSISVLGRHRSEVARLRTQVARARDRRQRDRMPAPWPASSAIPTSPTWAARQQRRKQAHRPVRWSGSAVDHEIRDRMSFMRTREIRENVSRTPPPRSSFATTPGADGPCRSGKPVVVPDLLTQRGWTDLDYLKIDIDGAIRDPANLRRTLRYVGRPSPSARGQLRRHRAAARTHLPQHRSLPAPRGFDLFRSMCAIAPRAPCPPLYLAAPAETVSGRRSRARPTIARCAGASPR